MGRQSRKTTSLWAVVEGMQRRLEAEGLERDVVDAAVTRGLEALLDITPPRPPPPRRSERRAAAPWIRPRVLAKA